MGVPLSRAPRTARDLDSEPQRAALQAGDPAGAWSAAAGLPRVRLGLDHALALVALLSLDDEGPVERCEAAVNRWIDRAHEERPVLAAAPMRRLLDWLPDLGAVTELQTILRAAGVASGTGHARSPAASGAAVSGPPGVPAQSAT